MDDLTANSEVVLASLGGAPKMYGEEEKDEDREEQKVGRMTSESAGGGRNQEMRYRDEGWGVERRFSEEEKGMQRQRSGARGRA